MDILVSVAGVQLCKIVCMLQEQHAAIRTETSRRQLALYEQAMNDLWRDVA